MGDIKMGGNVVGSALAAGGHNVQTVTFSGPDAAERDKVLAALQAIQAALGDLKVASAKNPGSLHEVGGCMTRITYRFGLLFPVATGAMLFVSTGIALAEQTQDHGAIDFSGNRIWIVVLIIALMAGLFSFLFFWQNRIEQSGYFARIYRQAVENIEMSRNIVPLRRDWSAGRYVDELLQASTDRAKEWQKRVARDLAHLIHGIAGIR